MIKKYLFENIKDILSDGHIENYKIKQKFIINEIFKDKKLNKEIYKQFYNNFLNFEIDDLFMKTQDLLYRLDVLIDQYFIKEKGLSEPKDIIYDLKQLMNDDIDLTSGTDYTEDMEQLFDFDLSERDVSI